MLGQKDGFHARPKRVGRRGQKNGASEQLRQRGGAWLKQCRKQAGVTQRALAEHLGLACYASISHFESGRERVPAAQIEQYALALGWEPAEFAKRLLMFYSPSYYRVIWGFPDEAGLGR